MPPLVVEDDLHIIGERGQRLLHVDVIEPRPAVDGDQGRALRDTLTRRKPRRARHVEPQANAMQIKEQSDLPWLHNSGRDHHPTAMGEATGAAANACLRVCSLVHASAVPDLIPASENYEAGVTGWIWLYPRPTSRGECLS